MAKHNACRCHEYSISKWKLEFLRKCNYFWG